MTGWLKCQFFWNILVPVRVGPNFPEIFWSWSELVRAFPKICGPGPSWSEFFQIFAVRVRSGPRTGPNRLVRGSLP